MSRDWLLQRMEGFGERVAIVWQDESTSYRQLIHYIEVCTHALNASGVQPGDGVALISDHSPHATAMFLALAFNCNISILLAPGSSGPIRERLLDRSEARWMVTLDSRDQFIISPREVDLSEPLLRQLREKGDPGLVLFSSGSSGESRAILHSFDRILDEYKRVRLPMSSLLFLMFDHMGGLDTLLKILSSGGTAVSIAERTPAAVCQAIERFKVQLLPTSPTFLNMLLMSEAYKQYDLSSLQFITYGTEPMPPATLARIAALFPNATLKQTYGLSELGVIPSRSLANGSLQIQLGGEGFATRVQNGTLWIKSPSAMLGYLNQPAPFDADGWLDTGDVVEVDGEWLRILGRRSELINVGGEKVSPVEVESTILQMDNIRDVAVRGKRNPVTGNIVTARVELHHPEDEGALKQRLQAFCAARLPRHKVPILIEIGEIPQSERFKKIRRED